MANGYALPHDLKRRLEAAMGIGLNPRSMDMYNQNQAEINQQNATAVAQAQPPEQPTNPLGSLPVPHASGLTYEQAYEGAAQLPFIKEQRDMLEAQKEALRSQLATPSQVDLSPIAGWLSATTGKDWSGAYQKPQDRQDLIQKIRGQIQAGQGQLSEEQRRTVGDILRDLANPLGSGAGRKTGTERLFQDYAKAIKGHQELVAASNTALATLKSGGPIAESAVQIMLARASGERGALSDQDIARWQGSGDLVSKAQRAFSKAASGHKFTEADRDEVEALAQLYAGRGIEDMQLLARQYEAAAPAYGANANDFRTAAGGFVAPVKSRQEASKQKSSSSNVGTGLPSKEAIAAEMARRKKPKAP